MTVSPVLAPSLTCCSSDALAEETMWTSSGRQHVRCYLKVGIQGGLLIRDDDSHYHVWDLGTGTRLHTCECGAHRCIRRSCSAMMLPNRDGLCAHHWDLSERCRTTAEAREKIGNTPAVATLSRRGRIRQ